MQIMPNPLFHSLGGNRMPAVNDGGFGSMMKEFAQFRQSFSGNPQAEVQRLLNSGQMSQAQYNQLAAVANQIMPMLK